MNYFAALALAFLTPLAAQTDRFGIPSCSAPDQELASRTAFLVCYSSTLKVPVWTGYELTPSHLPGDAPRPTHFRHDRQLTGASAYDFDYRNSGFSRGHMVPAADCTWSEDAMRDTFLLSNAVPQKQGVNSGKWRMLENFVRRTAATADAVYIFSGPVFSSPIEFIGDSKVAVPTHTFKVVLVLRGDRKIIFAAIVPNAQTISEPLDHFAVPAQEVEARTGLRFFNALQDSERSQLEAQRHPLTANNDLVQ